MSRILPCLVFLAMASLLVAEPIPGVKEETRATFETQYASCFPFDPAFYPIPENGAQACVSRRISSPEDSQLVIECEFSTNNEGPEYLSIGTPFFFKKPGYLAGVRVLVEDWDAKTGEYCETQAYPIRFRLVDPSGEYHQVDASIRIGEWCLAAVQTTEPHWGGDNDGVLQFPCALEYIVVDRPGADKPRKCRVTLREIRTFRRHELESPVSIWETSPTESENLPPHVYTLKNVPSTLEFEARLNPEFAKKFESVPEIRLQIETFPNASEPTVVALRNWQPAGESLSTHFTLPLSREVGFQSLLMTPLFTNTNEEKRTFGAPMKFSYSILPETAFDDWLGICTHYAHGWNRETQRFLPPAGIRFFRDEMSWGACEPEKGTYVFPESWDAYIDAARAQGLEPLIILDYSNKFYDDGDFPHSDEAVAGFANYCRAIATHFKGRVKYYEIWNEWTGGCGMSHHMAKGNNTPENYVHMAKAASLALREVDSSMFIIGGGGDHHTYHFPAIESMLKLGLMEYCDAFSVHPYVYPKSPETADVAANLQKVIDCMRANGCAKPNLWLTELGWPTHLGGQAPGFGAVDATVREALEARMFVRAALAYRALPEVGKFFWYDLKNDGTDMRYNECNFGIIHNDAYHFQPKAAYQSAGVLASLTSGASVEISEKYTTSELAVYVIHRPGAEPVYVAWSLDSADTGISVPFQALRAQNLYGESIPVPSVLTSDPVYFFGIDVSR